MQIERTRRLEHAVKLYQARSHLDDIRHHLILANTRHQGADERGHTRWNSAPVPMCRREIRQGQFGPGSPMPGIFKSDNLGVALLPGLVLEDDVVVAI